MIIVSLDGTRAIDDAPAVSYAAYVGAVEDGAFRGRHSGVFSYLEDAESWLASGVPEPSPVYGRATEPST